MNKQRTQNFIMQVKRDIGRMQGEDAETLKRNFFNIYKSLIKNKGKNIPRICCLYKITDESVVNVLSNSWNKFLQHQKQGSNMIFFASLSEEELRTMLIQIQKKHPQHDINFEKVVNEFKSDFKKLTNHYIRSHPNLFDRADQIENVIYEDFYNLIKQRDIPETNIKDFIHQLLHEIITKKFTMYYRDHFVDHKINTSEPTKNEMKKMYQWIDDYKHSYHITPSIKQISESFNIPEDVVRKYLIIRSTETNKDDQTNEIDLYHSDLQVPHEKYEKRERDKFIKQTVNKIQKQLFNEFILRFHGKHADVVRSKWDRLFYKIYNNHGRNIESILSQFGINEETIYKMLQRLWKRFIELLKNDKELKEYMLTAKKHKMEKIAQIIYLNNFEEKLKNIK